MREIKISEILNLLEKGYTRDMLKKHYSLTNKEIKNLFTHPKLKGLKAKKALSFEIIDDTVKLKAVPTFTYEEIAQSSVVEEVDTDVQNLEQPEPIDFEQKIQEEQVKTEKSEILFNN
ncbi:MAG TPA: hypothetical protein P5513_01660 [Candidatus Diapherotrites archaeon]|nr:hypothetical protein [Candidatus Diapherotrites archaeon]